jgi:hypothetical protein
LVAFRFNVGSGPPGTATRLTVLLAAGLIAAAAGASCSSKERRDQNYGRDAARTYEPPDVTGIDAGSGGGDAVIIDMRTDETGTPSGSEAGSEAGSADGSVGN